jgi:hypothetical protein
MMTGQPSVVNGLLGIILLIFANAGCHRVENTGKSVWSIEARRREAMLANNPNDQDARVDQIRYFRKSALEAADAETESACTSAQVRHVIWFINNAPAANVLAEESASTFGGLELEERREVEIAWRNATAKHYNDQRVLENALRCELFGPHGRNADYASLWRRRLAELNKPAE